jgi:hypothetical protein
MPWEEAGDNGEGDASVDVNVEVKVGVSGRMKLQLWQRK